jgi:hypothetical protein
VETMTLKRTELGHQVVKDRSVSLTPRQRAALILIDGRRTMDELHAAIVTAGISAQELDRLLELGLVFDPTPEATAAAAKAKAKAIEAEIQHSHRSEQERFAEAYRVATQLTASLGLRGFRLNLAVEAASDYNSLRELAGRIREAVGADKCVALERALHN